MHFNGEYKNDIMKFGTYIYTNKEGNSYYVLDYLF